LLVMIGHEEPGLLEFQHPRELIERRLESLESGQVPYTADRMSSSSHQAASVQQAYRQGGIDLGKLLLRDCESLQPDAIRQLERFMGKRATAKAKQHSKTRDVDTQEADSSQAPPMIREPSQHPSQNRTLAPKPPGLNLPSSSSSSFGLSGSSLSLSSASHENLNASDLADPLLLHPQVPTSISMAPFTPIPTTSGSIQHLAPEGYWPLASAALGYDERMAGPNFRYAGPSHGADNFKDPDA